jgi:hypothetical protein
MLLDYLNHAIGALVNVYGRRRDCVNSLRLRLLFGSWPNHREMVFLLAK